VFSYGISSYILPSVDFLKRIQCYFSYFQHDEDARGRDDGTMEG
jgi:hypothetical protein